MYKHTYDMHIYIYIYIYTYLGPHDPVGPQRAGLPAKTRGGLLH